MSHLEAIETLRLKLANLRLASVVAQVRRDDDPADFVHQTRDLLQRREWLFDVGGPATPQVSREGFVHVDGHPQLDEGPGHVRAPDGAAIRRPFDIVELDI